VGFCLKTASGVAGVPFGWAVKKLARFASFN
jgi:hypothetical protein